MKIETWKGKLGRLERISERVLRNCASSYTYGMNSQQLESYCNALNGCDEEGYASLGGSSEPSLLSSLRALVETSRDSRDFAVLHVTRADAISMLAFLADLERFAMIHNGGSLTGEH